MAIMFMNFIFQSRKTDHISHLHTAHRFWRHSTILADHTYTTTHNKQIGKLDKTEN